MIQDAWDSFKTLKRIDTLERCMKKAAAFGLSLTEEERKILVKRKFSALKKYGRIEFGGGVMEEIVLAFCESDWISPDPFAETLAGLQDIFYCLNSKKAA